MKPKFCTVKNFASYQDCTFDFSDLCLALISGPTGSGKSTLADFIPWILWGVTSKGGSVEEIRSWQCKEPTTGILDVEVDGVTIQVIRIRGSASQNDLYWHDFAPGPAIRGKDLADTQKLLNQRLGMDSDGFLISSYFSQFSESDKFFTAKPKDRRDTLERISDLSTPVKLSEAASEARKLTKKELEAAELSHAKGLGRVEQLIDQANKLEEYSAQWEITHATAISTLEAQSASFEESKAGKVKAAYDKLSATQQQLLVASSYKDELEDVKTQREGFTRTRAQYQKLLPVVADLKSQLTYAARERAKQALSSDVCPQCNRPGANPDRDHHVLEAQRVVDEISEKLTIKTEELKKAELAVKAESTVERRYEALLAKQKDHERLLAKFEAEKVACASIENAPNVYLDRLTRETAVKNPHEASIAACTEELGTLSAAVEAEEEKIQALRRRVTSLSTIYDLSFVLRGELLRAAVSNLERSTNESLTKYFDGVFRVKYVLEDSDKLSVEITKNGFEASFRQLSGGERRQLVLSFWRALAKRAMERSGVSISLAILDEAMNGLDDELKVKAFRLLEDLSSEYESVLVIDHSEALKAQFQTTFTITKEGDSSVVIQGESEQEAAA